MSQGLVLAVILLFELLVSQFGELRIAGLAYILTVVAAGLIGGILAGLSASALFFLYILYIHYSPFTAMDARPERLVRELIGAAIVFPIFSLIGGGAHALVRRARSQAQTAHAERERVEELQRLIFDSSLDAIIVMDQEGKVTLWNRNAETMFGWAAHEVTGRRLTETIIPERFRRNHEEGLSRYLEKGEGIIIDNRLELSALGKDGREFPVEVSVVSHETPHGKIFVGILRDISERKHADRAIRELNARLEQRVAERTAELMAANKDLEAFGHSVSHDLRTPLRSIDGFSTLLLQDYGDKLDAEGREYLERLRTASLRMAQLIDDLLVLSRVTRAEMHREEVDLSKLVVEILSEIQAAEPERKGTLDIEPGLNAYGDPRLLRILLENLLSNAWKFTSKNEAETHIRFRREQVDGHEVFVIGDNGAGFNMEHTGQMFEPFFRLHKPEEFAGTGIGLATVKRIAQRHGGDVWAKGKVGEGAEFYFTLEAPVPAEVPA